VPLTPAVAAEQQKVADTFYELKLIPKPVRIADALPRRRSRASEELAMTAVVESPPGARADRRRGSSALSRRARRRRASCASATRSPPST
jgi:hypothetical protein